jgi:multidrug efflux pump subunit AcrA (membrane-fusion protein)
VGLPDGDRVEVVSGLNSGERIVVDGHAGLADGSRVKER